MSFIRRALGAPPRRFSDSFVRSERCALHAHRDRCRSLYEVRNASDSSILPPGVPPQCVVGQTVVARHPMLRTLHDGDVLTVGASTYMVQFHRSELGVGKVPDTDLAPADSLCWTPLVRADIIGGSSMGGASSGGAQDVPQVCTLGRGLMFCRYASVPLCRAMQPPADAAFVGVLWIMLCWQARLGVAQACMYEISG